MVPIEEILSCPGYKVFDTSIIHDALFETAVAKSLSQYAMTDELVFEELLPSFRWLKERSKKRKQHKQAVAGRNPIDYNILKLNFVHLRSTFKEAVRKGNKVKERFDEFHPLVRCVASFCEQYEREICTKYTNQKTRWDPISKTDIAVISLGLACAYLSKEKNPATPEPVTILANDRHIINFYRLFRRESLVLASDLCGIYDHTKTVPFKGYLILEENISAMQWRNYSLTLQ